MKKGLTLLVILVMGFQALLAQETSVKNHGFFTGLKVNARVGFNVGGTMPLGMPASIRKLEKYDFKLNPAIGLDAEKQFNDRWGLMAGIRLERKGMEIEAKVKNYHMSIVRGGESLTGQFTGHNHTTESQWMITIPICATLHVQKVRISAGPYFSYVTDRQFEGYAFDGYLRVDSPTGPKVELGSTETERGSYDFASDMRRFQWGLQAGADWKLRKHFGLFAMVKWGLMGIHKSSFHTIEQTLYPIYGTVGVTYFW